MSESMTPTAVSTTPSSPASSLSPIAELQETFGSILLLTREKYKHPTPEVVPRWTGSFRLFDFPRELRDRIYHYVLYSPNNIAYRRSKARIQWPFEEPKHTQLFLVSRQVYYEALQIFLMDAIVMITYRTHLAGTLRLFPDKAGRIIQRIKIDYHPGAWRTLGNRRGLSGSWEQILTDSRLSKEFLPSLREFLAVWRVNHHDLNVSGLDFEGKSLQERSEIWARFFHTSYAENKLVPSEWLKVEFAFEYNNRHKYWQASFDEAFKIFRKEVGGQEEDLEASGRKWLEEAYGNTNRKMNTRQRRQARLADIF